MSNDPILSLLGLALRGNHLAVGEEPVESVARARDARVLLLAADAADNTRRRIERFADAGQCLWIRVPFTKEQLGRAVGRSSVAVTAVTDIGLAAALVRRLADRDPERYGESARRLDVKSQRAAERKSELLAHEKNLRQGRHKGKALEEPAAKQDAAPEQKSAPRKGDSSPRSSVPPRDGFGAGRPGPRKDGFGAGRPGPRKDGFGAGKPGPRKDGFGAGRPGPRKDGFGAGRPGPRKDGFGAGRPAASADGSPERKFSSKPPFRKEEDAGKGPRPFSAGSSPYRGKSRPSKANRPKPRAKTSAYLNSHPVKKGKGSFRKKES